jgi:hypothetical protein
MIVKKENKEKLVTAPVLIPNYKDCDYQNGEKILTADEIKNFAHKYMSKYRIADKQHEYLKTNENIAVPVESWITNKEVTRKSIDGTVNIYPKGTWFVTMKVHDNDTWTKIENGTYNGFSVTVIPQSLADKKIIGSHKDRVLIKDVPDPAVATISIVDKPCVYNAKFCSIKSNNKGVDMTEKVENQGKLLQIVNKFLNDLK